MNRDRQLELEIKEFFSEVLNIELEDSPQILDTYLYLEFDDYCNGGEIKFRLPYPQGRQHFLEMDIHDKMIFIVFAFMKSRYGNK